MVLYTLKKEFNGIKIFTKKAVWKAHNMVLKHVISYSVLEDI